MMNKLYKSWTEETGFKAPATVSIEVTIRCNMRCPMCDRTHKEDYIKSFRRNQLKKFRSTCMC